MPVAHARPEAVGEINTLLGRGREFEGKLTFEESRQLLRAYEQGLAGYTYLERE